jgi:hypothetical protein
MLVATKATPRHIPEDGILQLKKSLNFKANTLQHSVSIGYMMDSPWLRTQFSE